MTITTSQVQGTMPADVAITILSIQGDLDATNYQAVIDAAQAAYEKGARRLILDLSGVPFMSSSGLVALHSVALLMQGKEPPDPEYGWAAFRAAGRDAESGRQKHVKLSSPQPRVQKALELARFDRFFEVCDDLETAVASF